MAVQKSRRSKRILSYRRKLQSKSRVRNKNYYLQRSTKFIKTNASNEMINFCKYCTSPMAKHDKHLHPCSLDKVYFLRWKIWKDDIIEWRTSSESIGNWFKSLMNLKMLGGRILKWPGKYSDEVLILTNPIYQRWNLKHKEIYKKPRTRNYYRPWSYSDKLLSEHHRLPPV